MRFALVLLAAAVLACSVAAQEPSAPPAQTLIPIEPEPPPPGPVITNPRWIERPSGRDFAALYPPIAAMSDMNGRVVLDCLINAQGRLACTVETEEPEGFGFGEASLAASRRFRISPRLEDGRPVDGARVRVPMRWMLGGPPSTLPANLIRMPRWTERPTPEEMAAAFPEAARGRAGAGFAVLACTIAPGGRPQMCMVWTEYPAALGFGDAALGLAPAYRMAATLSDGQSVGRPVLVPFRWGASQPRAP